MIRINLLGVERQKAQEGASPSTSASSSTLACSLILVVAGASASAGGTGRSTRRRRALDAEIAAAQQRSDAAAVGARARCSSSKRGAAQLQQRVALIEQLRSGQSVPVQLLDHVSRSLPDMLWLTEHRAGRATT